MGKKLSHELLDRHYFSVLGTTEEGQLVERGAPLTGWSNNGVICFNDEEGRPWVKANYGDPNIGAEFRELVKAFGVRRQNIHVPHSNDSRRFVETLQKMMSWW